VTASDSDLVARARSGDEAACREIVIRYERPIFNLIARMVHDRSLAEDLSQETFLKAFTRLGLYDARYKLSNWLFKIAHNTVIDHLRQRRPATVSLEESSPAERDAAQLRADAAVRDPFEKLAQAELAQVLGRAVAALRPEYRQVVILRYHEDFSHEEIADVMAIPVGTVKSYLHRARLELADILKRQLPVGIGEGPGRAPATGTPPEP
jgi:RNA polymerase sigma-70 factor (ECF subfamily)